MSKKYHEEYEGMTKERFRKILSEGISGVVAAGKYDWNKAWKYMRKKRKSVTVTEIHRKVMSEVHNRRQVRAWMERQVKAGRLEKAKDLATKRTVYMPRDMLRKERKKSFVELLSEK